MAYPPQRPIPARPAITPHTAWYWLGGVLAVLGALTGVIAGLNAALSAPTGPETGEQFAVGTSHIIVVSEEETSQSGWELYALTGPEWQADAAPITEWCTLLAPDGQSEVALDTSSHWVLTDGAQEWDLAALFTTATPGSYELTCEGPSGVTYGVLYDDPLDVLGRGVAALTLILLVPPLCVIGGVIIVVVTRGRRRNSMRRLGLHG